MNHKQYHGLTLAVIMVILLPGSLSAEGTPPTFKDLETSSYEDMLEDLDENALYMEEPFLDAEDVPEEEESQYSLLSCFKFTYSHETAYSPRSKTFFINRSQTRCEWKKLLSDIVFVKFDGNITLYLPKDHVAQAEDTKLNL